MGIDEILEVANSIKGHAVLIICNDGTEVRGRLTEIDEDLTAILADEKAGAIRVPLGDVNWMTRSDPNLR